MQSHGFRLTEKCGWKKDVYGREAAYADRYWNQLPEALAEMAVRLKGVQIENKPALEEVADPGQGAEQPAEGGDVMDEFSAHRANEAG